MADVLITDIPDNTILSYEQRAGFNRRSLEAELLDLLERNKSLTPKELAAIKLRSNEGDV